MGRPEDYLSFLAPDEIRVKGSRVGIESVLYCYLDEGMGLTELAARFPTLAVEDLRAVLEYRAQHPAAVDAYLAAVQAREDQAWAEHERNPSPVFRRLSRLKARATADGQNRQE